MYLIIFRLSVVGLTEGKLYPPVATNSADKGRDLELEIMSYIHGRALQLRHYIRRVTLVDVIPDVPAEFAKCNVSLKCLQCCGCTTLD